jgi:hypothetical protein
MAYATKIRRRMMKKRRKSATRSRAISEHYRNKRRHYQEIGRQDASTMPPIHREGCLLYWAEGTKNKESACFTNSDPDMMRFFARFLVECYGLDPNGFKLQLNCYLNNGLTLGDIQEFWKDVVGITNRDYEFQYCTVKDGSNSKRKRLKYGICQLRVNNVEVVQRIYGSIQEYWDIEKEEWLR